MLPAERIARTKDAFGDRIATSKLPKPYTTNFVTPPVLAPSKVTRAFDCYRLDQIEKQVEIIPGLKTPIWGYNGIAPGPTIRVNRGRQVVVRQVQRAAGQAPAASLQRRTSTHLHGSASLPQFDGYASDMTPPGLYKAYQYPNFQGARTLWYHDHGVHHTARTPTWAWRRSTTCMTSTSERALPQGEFDVPLTVRDAMFPPTAPDLRQQLRLRAQSAT